MSGDVNVCDRLSGEALGQRGNCRCGCFRFMGDTAFSCYVRSPQYCHEDHASTWVRGAAWRDLRDNNARMLYELVAQHFLASVSPDATTKEVSVTARCAE